MSIQSMKQPKPSVVQPAAPLTAKLLNNIFLVLDESGSMSMLRDDTCRVIDTYVETIRELDRASGQQSTIDVITFNHQAQSVGSWPADTFPTPAARNLRYYPSGNTALLDAVGVAIERGQKLPKSLNNAVLVVTITDGEENSSKFWNSWKLNDAIRRHTAEDWSFAFLLPPGKRRDFVSVYGIPAGNAKEWEASIAGLKDVEKSLSLAHSSYTATRATGKRQTANYFTPDLSGADPTQLLKKLDNITKDCKVWEIDKETTIKEFVEGKGFIFETGRGFYQLSKKEKVQVYKKFLLMKKGEKAVYGGNVRAVLGAPPGDFKIAPGDHGKFDIFVESTSTNRKLVRGSKFVYVCS